LVVYLYNIFIEEEQIKKARVYVLSFNVKQVMVCGQEKKTTKMTS